MDESGRDRSEGHHLASTIDHTLLKPTATAAEIRRLCAEAAEHRFAAVCVNGAWAEEAARLLAGASVGVAAVVGFPLGAMAPGAKAAEAAQAIADGATEIDMVMQIGRLKDGDDDFVRRDIEAVVAAARRGGRPALVKVIIETCFLTNEEKVRACRIAAAAGADFVKTSTGFGPAGATVEDVRLMRASVPARVGVKAAGGIRTAEAARAMLAAGATRIGTSSGVAIVSGAAGPAGP